MRAGVLHCGEPTSRHHNSESDPLPRFSAKKDRDARVKLIPLPDGVRAAAVGRRKLAGLGEPYKVDARMPGWAVLVLRYAGQDRMLDAHEIPGPVDVPMLSPQAIDVARMLPELEPHRATAMEIWKLEEGWLRMPRAVLGSPRGALRLARSVGGGLVEGVSDLRYAGPPQHERPPYEPVEGVAYDTWTEVLSGIKHDEVHAGHADAYAAYRGVPPGRWAAVDAAWRARAAQDPRLAAWMEYDRRRVF